MRVRVFMAGMIVGALSVIGSVIAGCTAQQKAAATTAFVGSADPATQPSDNSIEGYTAGVANTATVVAAATPGTPLQPIAVLIAAIASAALAAERATVRIIALLPNSKSASGSTTTGSGSTSGTTTAQPQPIAQFGNPPGKAA